MSNVHCGVMAERAAVDIPPYLGPDTLPRRPDPAPYHGIAKHAFGQLVGTSALMREVYDHISRVAPTSATVLIVGESGTGKELVARTLHDLSRRRLGPYIALNCSALSPMLIESELFGHERGSFTGADRRHHGVFERAMRGTLFLDEVTEMPAELQVKLLRVLETGTFTRTGGETPIAVDVRFLAATNRRPEEAIKQGKLREDLYYRLKVFQLSLRRLRDRPEDVPLLAEHFLTQTAALEGQTKQFTSEALAMLTAYVWPGNVRELKNAVYSAYILAGSEITVDCLPVEIAMPEPTPAPGCNIPVNIGMTAAEAERRLILATLSHFTGSKSKTAETLGISLKTLYNRLQEYRVQEYGQPTA
ncbi:MAG TPA: sigma-54 dependent transcriptional regulator [Vicinamibacterales bacterium]|nr:sigma-54 dependent transcriptional regulator [Vicinamibacterales bacterium]